MEVLSASVNGKRRVLATIEDWDAVDDRPIVEVEVPEFSKPGEQPAIVLLRAMSAGEREDWGLRKIASEQYEPDPERRMEQDRQRTWADLLKGQKVDLLARCIVNERGTLVFSQAQVSKLQDRNPAAIDRLYERAQELNGLSTEARVEDAVKNSSAGQSGDSSSDSPSPQAS